MAYILEKPYSDKEKADFIVEYNHKLGLKIEETESKLFALENNELLQNGQAIINPNYEQELLQKENSEICNRFLCENSSFKKVELSGENGYLTLMPHKNGTDGFFIAKFIKD